MRNALRQSSRAKDYIGDRLRENESFMKDVDMYQYLSALNMGTFFIKNQYYFI